MTRPILFRSLKSGRDRAGSAIATIRQRGSDWSHLRPYTDTDDIRDIAWGRVRPEWLSVRVRETRWDYPIISYWGSSSHDGFWTEHPRESREYTIVRARHIIRESARFGQYTYSEYSGDTGLDQIVMMQPRNALIFVSNTPITEDLRLLAYHNDLICLDFIHPFEIDPNQNTLFSWKVLDIDEYIHEYSQIQSIRKNTIKKIRASHLPILTTANIADSLNIFFKKRYTHG